MFYTDGFLWMDGGREEETKADRDRRLEARIYCLYAAHGRSPGRRITLHLLFIVDFH